MLTFGLIINPYAGIGGSVGLKGSDGEAIVEEALRRGAQQKAMGRTETALALLQPFQQEFRFLTCPGDMGENVLKGLGLSFDLIQASIPAKTSAQDTRAAAMEMAAADVDVLVFAGGDGTARDICAALSASGHEELPVLGIPAGVKIHSGVYGVTPLASGEVLKALLEGGLVDIRESEVRDLDEEAFRQNKVQARHYGDMRVPQAGHFVQSVKQGGVEVEELVLADIAAYICEEMEEGVLYLLGSGKTTQAVMEQLGLENTLLGVDAVFNGNLIGSDLNEQALSQLFSEYPQRHAVLSVMGGQGHIFGRGNQQFSAALLRQLGKKNISVISTKTKIQALQGRALLIDSGDVQLDQEWSGTIEVITGYHDRIVQPLSA